MKQENKSKEIQDRKLVQRGRATSDKRKKSIVNTRIIGNLYRTSNGSGGDGGIPESKFAAQ